MVKRRRESWCKIHNNVWLICITRGFSIIQRIKKHNKSLSKSAIFRKCFKKDDINDLRFVPYIQLHEFETLVLANPKNIALEYFDNDNAIQTLQAVLDEHKGNPELINENPASAPSKRIIEVIPDYDKVNVGASIAGINGIDFLKNSCRHFKSWIDILEELSVH